MSGNPKPEELPGLIAKGLEMVEQRLNQSSRSQIYNSIKAQLLYMKQTVEAHAKPSDEKLDSLTIGIYAAREFETSDPDLADLLFNVEYLFKRL
jgi:hypothetical protein